MLRLFKGTDAFGSSTEESFNGNAFETARTFDASTGRLLTVQTGVTATPKGIQDLEYKWREDGALHRRIDHRGTTATSDDLADTFAMDPLSRVTRQATTGGATRTLDFDYDDHGNLESKTSSATGDLDATAYTYGTSGKPHRLTQVTLGGVATTLSYDANGNITGYDAATGDDTAVVYDGQNRVTSITTGTTAPKDEFWHGPDGARYLRRETWTEDGASKTKLTVYLGAYEEVRRSDATVKRVRASGSVVRVRVEPTSGTTTERFEFLHRDHLGSVDRVTDGTGAAAATLSSASFDPFGGRRAADWSGDESAATHSNVLALQDERFSRGFTDHEGLHRTGFVHMNGRVYDPRIGRFLQPDPVVAAPHHSQGHNRYAYVANAPLSATDPSGLAPVGGYVGRTGGVADYGALYGSIMNDLWGYAGRQGIPVYDLSGFDSIIAGGLDNNQLDDYLRTGRDPRIIIKGGELIFPEGGPDELSEYYTKIVTAGVGVDRNEFMDILEDYWEEGKRVAGYHNPSHGLPFDVLEAIDQKLFPSTDNLAEGLAREIIRAGWGGRIVGHSQGTLTVVNAVRMLPRRPDQKRVHITLLSPAVSYPTAARFGGGGANYRQPWFDIANLWAPSLNPIKWGSGFVDVLCGACVHRANGLGTE